MSRAPRAGAAGKPVTIRAVDAERSRWEAAAKHAGVDLSSFARQAMLELAEAGKGRVREWMKVAKVSAEAPRMNKRSK